MENKAIKVIISGGGTGGHIFPAISIADSLKKRNPDTEILFVGASGKMEMEKVPAAGYKIIDLPIVGLQRQFNWRNFKNNISIPFKIIASLIKARKVIKEFKPDVVVGVGGYASAPLLWSASRMNIPSLIQEQNGFAGLSNKILSKKVDRICVAYDNMERFFPADKIVFTGNPTRSDIKACNNEQKDIAFDFYKHNKEKRQIFIVGGSLGSSTLNKSMINWILEGCEQGEDVQILWQCGKFYKNDIDKFIKEQLEQHKGKRIEKIIKENIHYSDFIGRMDLAYNMADIVITRSGASTVSELCIAHKACIFVPSPNVAEDHQTHNAMALVNKNAGLLVKDKDAPKTLMSKAIELVKDKEKISKLEENIALLEMTDSASLIVDEIYKIL